MDDKGNPSQTISVSINQWKLVNSTSYLFFYFGASSGLDFKLFISTVSILINLQPI